MTTADLVEPGKLDIGRVISQTFGVIGRNLLVFGGLSLLLYGLPLTILGILQVQFVGPDLSGANLDFSYDTFAWWGVVGLGTVLSYAILQGALIYGTVQDLDGKRPTLGECFATGLRSFLPLIGLAILLYIALVCGFFLLIVPGFMMLVAWAVAVPSLVADRTGVMGAFSRSAELTRGNRWRIFGLLIISAIILWVIELVFGIVSGGAAIGAALQGDIEAAQAAAFSPVVVISNALSNTITAMLSATGFAVLYVELRKTREGMGPQWLSEIFS